VMLPDGNRILDTAIGHVRAGGPFHPLTVLMRIWNSDEDPGAHANALLQTVAATGCRTIEEWWRQKKRTRAEVVALFETAMTMDPLQTNAAQGGTT
jgi:hypothetical protein